MTSSLEVKRKGKNMGDRLSKRYRFVETFDRVTPLCKIGQNMQNFTKVGLTIVGILLISFVLDTVLVERKRDLSIFYNPFPLSLVTIR